MLSVLTSFGAAVAASAFCCKTAPDGPFWAGLRPRRFGTANGAGMGGCAVAELDGDVGGVGCVTPWLSTKRMSISYGLELGGYLTDIAGSDRRLRHREQRRRRLRGHVELADF